MQIRGQMRSGAVGIVLCAFLLGGCTKTDTTLRSASAPVTEFRLKLSVADSRTVQASSLELVNGTLSGTLQPTLACRLVPTSVTKREALETLRPNWAANTVLIGFGVLVTTISGLVFANAASQSSEKSCTSNDPSEYDCLSPRSKQKIWSVGGILVGGTTITVGGLGLARRPRTRVVGEAAPLEVDGKPEGQALGCFDQERLVGVDLVLTSHGRTVASDTTDSLGTFRFNVPQPHDDDLDIVVESVPADLMTYVPKGLVVARYIAPPALTVETTNAPPLIRTN